MKKGEQLRSPFLFCQFVHKLDTIVERCPSHFLPWKTIFVDVFRGNVGWLNPNYFSIRKEFIDRLTDDVSTKSICFAWRIVEHAKFMVNDGNYSIMLTNEQWIIVTIGHQDITLFVHFTISRIRYMI